MFNSRPDPGEMNFERECLRRAEVVMEEVKVLTEAVIEKIDGPPKDRDAPISRICQICRKPFLTPRGEASYCGPCTVATFGQLRADAEWRKELERSAAAELDAMPPTARAELEEECCKAMGYRPQLARALPTVLRPRLLSEIVRRRTAARDG